MKFHWFHLMPWPYLPDDFQQKHRSVWVDVDYSLFDEEKANHVYHEYLDELEFAEKVGFDGICVNEHHSNAYGLMPSPNIMAATLTRRTNRAAIVVMGNSIALYNPPLRVAEEFAMLDILSGGRLVAGFPVGTSMDTNFAYGVPGAQLRERYYEAHDLIMQAWHNEGVSHFNGKYTQIRYMNPWPRPLQKPNPPIWIPGGGSIETWEWCADMGYLYSYLSYSGYKRAQTIMDGFWARMRDKGVEPNPYHAGFAQVVCVADNAAEAKELYWPHIDYFYNRCLHVFPGFADAPGYRTLRTVKAGIKSQFEQAQQNAKARLSWEGLVEQGYVIAGGPDYVTEKLNELAENLRVGHLMLLLQMGSMPRDVAIYNTQMFAEKVMPNLRDKFNEFEDRWYPKPLPPERRAVPKDEPVRPLRSPFAAGVGGA
ncbi:LLM class flavin-dependent oxidoreductase [Tepidiforma thermophila]|uniref:Alkanesulfonate monooxygenase SsuD/methylene tetrahydromethanopterin reductase-like flavin-dependent oxidoreductase (Luciferase family) n=1 Tax=Tepidiforma thermophila (strain KCTC 52669 / CGMCC 1.13589 / G233) TaxID=2761530 RepID=A0A2A9HG07_TEPT2|nr:LLM class flavin-dependent oxidoreductase [Tepidiforma thermophila]PFG74020.1 alkanesulfonate monooxygenase SsuD/methylene tetrahydromethanopterin reductase-like flavin-dependent oxidoreductase (luciferase family) [Tepidiforma thermophila]